MNWTTITRALSLDEAAALRPQQVVDLSRELAAAKHQLDWFKRQLFGQKSERRIIAVPVAMKMRRESDRHSLTHLGHRFGTLVPIRASA